MSEESPDPRRVRLWRRLAAAVYDLLLVLALLMLMTWLVILARRGSPYDPGSLWYRLSLLVVWWGYFAWSWTRAGQTVGMRAWRFVIRNAEGELPTLSQASVRFAAAWLSAIPFGLGYLYSLIDREGLTWHDRLSKTRLTMRTGSTQAQYGDPGNP